MKTILLIRHPETTMAGRFCGHANPDLNTAGEVQLARIVDRVASLCIDRIVSSDLLRAWRAAQAISHRIDVAVDLRPRLREIGFGFWEDLTWAEIEEQFPREAAAWLSNAPPLAAPGGEPYEIFSARVRDEFEAILASSENYVTAIVTHRGVMDLALTAFFNVSGTEAWNKTAQYGTVLCLTGIPHSISQYGTNNLADKYSYALEVL